MLPSFDDYLYAKEEQKPTTTKKQKKHKKNKKKQIQKQISLDSFHRYWWSKNLAIWLDQRHKQLATLNQEGLSHATFTWWLSPSTKNQWEWAILPRDIDDQRIIQSDWTRDTTDHTHPK